ncbi:MAG: AgmX/PglI C-terminal domain-containing protein [Deltaproteobacteria bacterium]|nr:AgmX/PglI C-terminal domain-containing protein [Deltaproteobacteria bacterium]
MQKLTATALCATLAIGSVACTFIARPPEQYRDDTQAVLAAAGGNLKACYDGVIMNDKNAKGTVTVKFTVEPETGVITKAKVDEANSTAPAPVQDCVVQTLGGLKLDPPDAREGQATFSYQFDIAPQKQLPPAPAPAAG